MAGRSALAAAGYFAAQPAVVQAVKWFHWARAVETALFLQRFGSGFHPHSAPLPAALQGLQALSVKKLKFPLKRLRRHRLGLVRVLAQALVPGQVRVQALEPAQVQAAEQAAAVPPAVAAAVGLLVAAGPAAAHILAGENCTDSLRYCSSIRIRIEAVLLGIRLVRVPVDRSVVPVRLAVARSQVPSDLVAVRILVLQVPVGSVPARAARNLSATAARILPGPRILSFLSIRL